MAQDNRRYDLRGARESKGPRGLSLHEAASTDKNLFFEQTCAVPNYSYSRAIPQSTTDVDPVAAPGSIDDSDKWDMNGFYGLRGYVELGGGLSSVNLELWHYDAQNGNWYRLATVSGLGDQHGFDFSGKARNGTVFVRSATVTGGGETITIRATGE